MAETDLDRAMRMAYRRAVLQAQREYDPAALHRRSIREGRILRHWRYLGRCWDELCPVCWPDNYALTKEKR